MAALRSAGGRRSTGRRRAGDAARPRPRAGSPRLAGLLLLVAAFLVFGTGILFSEDVRPGLQGRLHPLHFEDEIRAAAAKHGVDPYLVAAVARAESGYDPGVVSSAGAVGLMQIMPDTAQWIAQRDDWHGGPVGDLTDPSLNLELGAFYLAFLLDLFEGDVRSALAAYNAGQGTVAAWLQGSGGTSLDPADIPFAETREFVARVERFRELYRQAHPTAFLV